MKTTPPMTFDALPYTILRRILACLDRREMVEVSCADMKRAVLSFCLWERTPRREGGGCFQYGGEDDGDGGSDSSSGAPIYRFLRIGDGEEERQRDGGRDLKTVLASYPRSGNSLLRRLLEEVTGIITGSDTRPDRTLSRILSVFGLQGEGVVDERVRVVKTHFPERKGFREFEGKRVVLLVRNPFDSIDSYFNMALTNTHNKSLHDCVYSELAEHWDAMIRNEIKVWERFYSYWLTSGVPVHVIRFEDLVSRPEDCLREAVAFIYEISAKEVEEIFGDRIRRAPAAVITGGKAARAETHPGPSRGNKKCSDSTAHNSEDAGVATAGPYKPRTSAGVGRSLEKSFSKEQVAWCVREAGTYLRLFGYDPESQGFPPISDVDRPLLRPPLPRPERRHAECNDSGGVENGRASADAGVANSEADCQAPYHAEHNRRAVTATVTVNDENSSPLVRGKEDAFGRALTMFRRAHTARDTRPLPLQGEDGKAEQWQCRRRR